MSTMSSYEPSIIYCYTSWLQLSRFQTRMVISSLVARVGVATWRRSYRYRYKCGGGSCHLSSPPPSTLSPMTRLSKIPINSSSYNYSKSNNSYDNCNGSSSSNSNSSKYHNTDITFNSKQLLASLHPNVKLIKYALEVGIFAFSKPVDVLSHPNSDSEGDINNSIFRLPYSMDGEFFYARNPDGGSSEHKIWLLNRLDAGTSGVILCCTSFRTKGIVDSLFAKKLVQKEYIAKVFGLFKGPNVWEDYMNIDKSSNKQIVSQTRPVSPSLSSSNPLDGRGDKIAKTEVQIYKRSRFALSSTDNPNGSNSLLNIDNNNERPIVVISDEDGNQIRRNQLKRPPFMSLLRLRPHTGFTHQLRAQCLSHGLPIVGDWKYGDFNLNNKYEMYRRNVAIRDGLVGSTLDAAEAITNPIFSGRSKNIINTNSSSKSRGRSYLHSHSISFKISVEGDDDIGGQQKRRWIYFEAVDPIPDDFFLEFSSWGN